jgi:glycosyltransferase involved in cell wall biosynthesis
VVSTSVGGIPDALDQGRAGVLVPRGDTDALAAAIIDLVRQSAKRAALASRGRDWALAEYSEESMVSRYEALYRGANLASAPTKADVASCAE